MPSNTAASMFGGAGGRGSRASVASLEGLRNVMRNEPEKDSPAAAAAAPKTSAAPKTPAAPAAPKDDKQMMRGLNDRLSGYLDRVKQLKEENENLEKQIDEILAKRQAPVGRDWDETGKPLDDLKNKIKDITMDNAKLILQIDNTKLANEDFKNKLEDEKRARKELEKDLEDLKKIDEDNKRKCDQTKNEIDLVKEELDRLKKEHKDEVDDLCEKIKKSEVTVEIDSQNSNLDEVLNNIRLQYDKLAEKNLRDTDEWYQRRFDTIKVVDAKNTEALNSGKSELQELLKQKQVMEIKIQTSENTIQKLIETMTDVKAEYGQRMAPLNKYVVALSEDLKKMREQVEHQVETNKNLLCVKLKLEAEINGYRQLIHGITADTERPAKA